MYLLAWNWVMNYCPNLCTNLFWAWNWVMNYCPNLCTNLFWAHLKVNSSLVYSSLLPYEFMYKSHQLLFVLCVVNKIDMNLLFYLTKRQGFCLEVLVYHKSLFWQINKILNWLNSSLKKNFMSWTSFY